MSINNKLKRNISGKNRLFTNLWNYSAIIYSGNDILNVKTQETQK